MPSGPTDAVWRIRQLVAVPFACGRKDKQGASQVSDNAAAGRQSVDETAVRRLKAEESNQRRRSRMARELEAQPVADGLGPELRKALVTPGIQDARDLDAKGLVARLRANETGFAAEFAARSNNCGA